MDDLNLKQIANLIALHSGIQIRLQDYKSLAEKLWRRAHTLGLSSLNSYYQVLLKETEAPGFTRSDLGSGGASESISSEWQELYVILTINESYFFRDKNQYRLLSEQILPGIIHRNRREQERQNGGGSLGPKPRLRIWSAGCSTGEEIYSIAIVLEELKFPWDQWDVSLIGTDISKTAIESARKGLYGNWSFRQVPPNIQQKYFHPHHQLFKVSDTIRQRVIFQCGNLLQDNFPSQLSRLYDFDLILCRNVFIYLDEKAISQIISKFYDTLVPQGYLITGHTELYAQDTTQFHVLSFPESLVYQKLSPSHLSALPVATMAVNPSGKKYPARLPKAPSSSTPSLPRSTRRAPARGTPTLPAIAQSRSWNPLQSTTPDEKLEKALQEAESLLKKEAYASAIDRAEKIYTIYPQCDAAYKIAAHAYANIGSYDRAKQLCQQVLCRHPLSVDMYYLLAQIAEDQNELEITKEYLRKIIYLDASFVKAYLDLATIYEREKQPEKTQKMQNYALDLLTKLPPDAVLDYHSGTTVAQWKAHLERKSTVGHG